MKKVKIKGIPFRLNGETIEKGQVLNFKAINRKEQEVSIQDIKGLKIISFFPALNTRICDEQTQRIGQMAAKYPSINFISITVDNVETINKWCIAKELKNIDIWSDKKYGEFAQATNTLIKKIKKLARGFLVLDENNKIIDLALNQEISQTPDYSLIEKYITK